MSEACPSVNKSCCTVDSLRERTARNNKVLSSADLQRTPVHVTACQYYCVLLLAWNSALNHNEAMRYKARCREPAAQLIPVRREFGGYSNREYIPKCTVVYRCDSDAGRCHNEVGRSHNEAGWCDATTRCTNKTSQRITRHFLVTYLQ